EVGQYVGEIRLTCGSVAPRALERTGATRIGRSAVLLDEDVGAHLFHVAQAAQRHGDVEFLANDFQGFGNPGLAEGTKAVNVCSTDEDAFGAERQGLDNVLPGPYSAIHQNLDPVTHRLGDGGQRRDRGGCTVELPAAMVRNDDGVGSAGDGKLG